MYLQEPTRGGGASGSVNFLFCWLFNNKAWKWSFRTFKDIFEEKKRLPTDSKNLTLFWSWAMEVTRSRMSNMVCWCSCWRSLSCWLTLWSFVHIFFSWLDRQTSSTKEEKGRKLGKWTVSSWKQRQDQRLLYGYTRSLLFDKEINGPQLIAEAKRKRNSSVYLDPLCKA